MRSLNRGSVAAVVGELEGLQMKGEGVVVGEEVRRMMALVVGVVHLIEVKEVDEERWIVAMGVEEAHLIGAKGEVVEVRCLSQAVGEQGERMREVMEERSKMVPKVF